MLPANDASACTGAIEAHVHPCDDAREVAVAAGDTLGVLLGRVHGAFALTRPLEDYNVTLVIDGTSVVVGVEMFGDDVDTYGVAGLGGEALHLQLKYKFIARAALAARGLATPDDVRAACVHAIKWQEGAGDAALVRLVLDSKLADDVVHRQLCLAAACGVPSLVCWLLDAGARVDWYDPINERTALLHACIQGRVEIATILVERGAGVDFCDRSGETALIKAATADTGAEDLVRLLLRAGADVRWRDHRGRTAYDHSCAGRGGPGCAGVQMLLRV